MIEYCLYESDLKNPDGVGWYTNGNWIDSIDLTYKRKITEKSIIENAKILLEKNNCKYGCYNIDIIKGPKSVVQDSDFYEYCVGYANIKYDKEISVVSMEVVE